VEPIATANGNLEVDQLNKEILLNSLKIINKLLKILKEVPINKLLGIFRELHFRSVHV